MFLFFAIMILVVGSVMMYTYGLKWDPFFVPLDVFLTVTLVLLIVLSGVNFFFRNLEITYNTRDSQKYLMAKNSQRAGIVIIIVCVFVSIIVFAPFTADSARVILSVDGSESVGAVGESNIQNFENQDRLGLFKSEWAEVEPSSGTVGVQLCKKADFDADDYCDEPLYDRSASVTVPARVTVPGDGYEQLSLIVTGQTGPTSFDFHIERNPAPILIGIEPLVVCVVFVVMNVFWVVYLRPVKGRYATSSVYSEDYVSTVGAETMSSVETLEYTELIPSAQSVPVPKKRIPAPSAEEVEELPPPPLPGSAHPLPDGPFLDELILLLDSEGDVENTMGVLRTIIELDPVNKDALFHLGGHYQEQGNYKFALNEFDRITKIDPKDDEAWVRRGEVLMPLEREHDAVDSFREALDVNPSNAAAAEWLHSIKRENQKMMAKAIDRSTNKDFKGAIELYDRILARDPDNIQALLGKGTMYRRLEKWPASLESLNRVLELDSENVAAIRNKVDVFESVMRWDDALACYDEIIERSPDNYLDWIRRGDVLFELGRNEEAIESYRKAEELKPDSERVQKRIELLTTPAMDGAVKEFEKIKGIGKSKAIVLFEAGFQSMEDLENASIRKLSRVKGISKTTAKKIKAHFKE